MRAYFRVGHNTTQLTDFPVDSVQNSEEKTLEIMEGMEMLQILRQENKEKEEEAAKLRCVTPVPCCM